jgi:L-aminopeptidase/D-esterase-like protein
MLATRHVGGMANDGFTRVPGLSLGHAHDEQALTGVTVIVPAAPMVMGVDVRGGGPGTRETDALDPGALVDRVHGLVLAGGSVFGLAAADELVLLLSAAGHGLPMGAGVPPVPVVPAAILFDLSNGGDKAWGAAPPYRALARAALANLGGPDVSGRIGAGFGARAGSRAGGTGTAAVQDGDWWVGAVLAVNSFGDVHAGAPPMGDVAMPKLARHGAFSGNTCIGAVATNAPISRVQARRLAMMAHDGLARAIRPIHTPFDGDTLFAIGTADSLAGVDNVVMAALGTRAADMVALAARRAVGW